MDSLTQIVLGAACGEVALGKKIGNKALLFGAIGGIIPDLDVYVGSWLYGNEIDAMLFHRGFMHSMLFSVLGAFVFGWVTFKLYNTGKRLHTTTLLNWVWLYFLSLFTHPILDAFTPYGTQLFAPFSDYRVAFNNIAVVDPIYTVPFLICLIVMLFFKRNTRSRRIWLRLGLGISTGYLLFTFGNKLYIDSIFKSSLKAEGITYNRFFTQPTIFNNVLWYGVVDMGDSYYVAYYSLLDSSNRFSDWMRLPKVRDLSPLDYKRIERMAWFSNDYYSIYKMDGQYYRYNDLRYPLADKTNPNSSVFSFMLFKDKGSLNMKPFERSDANISEALSELWKRMLGV
ncbi:metal-dependent hydrolase [Hanstruepera neustonica]|uniref:Metal-dependent hydrolase n=1 Tax=Hanstruepera neustonica TaxID=1445657 RepID=A0A2K1DXL0_9FLAO|nr:metal-dependent hydrolase [Hanstruepera neustonica]PNQ72772.1 metal-dependent hydrolase [Hanstruepera neustonica]